MTGKKILSLIFVVLISFGTIGGCNNNNNNNNEGEFGGIRPLDPIEQCMTVSPPCETINMLQNGAVAQCVLSQTAACTVDLTDVTSQVGAEVNKQIDDTTIMWIEAWGGKGGDTDKATDGGIGGYAVTTSTVGDIASNNNMSTTIYYFIGGAGQNGPDHCGSGGGAGTIVTLENLPTSAPPIVPTTGFPPNGPNLLVAGGGGGGCGGNGDDGICQTGGGNCGENGGDGGIAIATMGKNGLGAGQIDPDVESGCSNEFNNWNTGCGGSDGMGGAWQGTLLGNQTNGMDGIGGLGGTGGSGQDCDTTPNTEPVGGVYVNSGNLLFISGMGGSGSSNTEMCDSGGGGGGGGYGGGGGGGHGDGGATSASGGGGGSVAFASTQSSGLSPTAIQDTPCGGSDGCVSISFVLP